MASAFITTRRLAHRDPRLPGPLTASGALSAPVAHITLNQPQNMNGVRRNFWLPSEELSGQLCIESNVRILISNARISLEGNSECDNGYMRD